MVIMKDSIKKMLQKAGKISLIIIDNLQFNIDIEIKPFQSILRYRLMITTLVLYFVKCLPVRRLFTH